MIQRRFIIRDIVSKVVDKEISLRWDKASEEPSWMSVLKYLRICIICLIVIVGLAQSVGLAIEVNITW